jgi:serine/threonine protein phosphatase PrpC
VVLSRAHPLRGTPNQDAAAVLPAGPDDSLLVVADGMGGTRGGGVAASTLIGHLSERLPIESPGELVRTAILNGIEAANRFLLEKIPDAGTTVAAVEVNVHTIRPYHVGDSAILVIGQRGKLKFQSVSHSPVGLAVEAGLLTEEEALRHHQRHLILNAVGSQDMRIELGAPLTLARHDTVLLASDGLTDNLTLDEIIGEIRSGPLIRGVMNLANRSRERMLAPSGSHPCKPDDITILAYRRSA